MFDRLWRSFIILALTLTSCSLWAEGYVSSTLNEANVLVEISPQQARDLIEKYLTERKLAEASEKTPSNVARGENDARIRTPASTVEALQILADAEFKLGNHDSAFKYIAQAKKLAKTNSLAILELDIALQSAQLQWEMTGDASEARAQLRFLSSLIENLKNAKPLTQGIQYHILMLRAQIASQENENELAVMLFTQAKPYVDKSASPKNKIDYHLAVGTHYLQHRNYNLALSELLIAYWSAVETNSSAQLAKANTLLARLFENRHVYDQALIYLSQAADFYDNYENSPVLATILNQMGNIYFRQGRYNLALVHYLNVLDHQKVDQNLAQFIAVRINLAATYIQLYNYPVAEDYLDLATSLLADTNLTALKAQAALLEARLDYHQSLLDKSESKVSSALMLAKRASDHQTELESYLLLSHIYEQKKDFKNALDYERKYNALAKAQQITLNQISEDAFNQQKEFVEQTLHLVGQEKKLKKKETDYNKLESITYVLFTIAFIFFLIILRRGVKIHRQNAEIDQINEHLFTHSRSQLSNLRMLSANLPNSLRKSSRTYEQWHIGELIHEPLNDRLRFAMIDIPFLRNMYLEYGFTAGMELELAFGEYLKSKLGNNTRLFHFTDANLLYVENNLDRDAPPQELFDKIKLWIDEFQPSRSLNRIIRMGIADYPFLPKAYTTINDKELLDILLMATSVSRDLSIQDKTSHWVHLKAIDNAPAASFASNNIRRACKQAINQGLIKVHSSHSNDDIIKKLLKND
ncbi:tetratricopeptide repeat protein [Vibrio sp.]|uniref:Tetratricopeptide repeat protein n=1 Tax=Vibrio viridaestus TaxID=2487322 RepID=A0A3N9TDY9_9VIBR|nr:tetratricopeptide repeat protein [Vibrio viridaestus]MDC0610423.1 tetratricopeptide repeat protein [Vibrio sp.]RQW62437.1 tetratricopeptide repeat protein [Vibrio viridaestus]